MTVLLAFNALSMLAAIVCAHRSYERHRNGARAVLAGAGGLLILPLIVVVAVAMAGPRAARHG